MLLGQLVGTGGSPELVAQQLGQQERRKVRSTSSQPCSGTAGSGILLFFTHRSDLPGLGLVLQHLEEFRWQH